MNQKLLFLWLFVLLLVLSSCEKRPEIDADGGYYDEKTKTYKYVWVGRKTIADDPQGVTAPRDGVIQQVRGKVVKITHPNSVWFQIPQRQTYMLLAQGVGPLSKDDKEKTIRFYLKNIQPTMIPVTNTKFRKDWKKYIIAKMEQLLLDKDAVITFNYESKANVFSGVITFNSTNVAEQEELRNFNLWMIEEGFSHYVFNSEKLPTLHKTYTKAEQSAQKQKKGIWKY